MVRAPALAGLLMTLLSLSGIPQEHQHGDSKKVGTVHFTTSCNEVAQMEFDRAVALLHSFQFSRAIQGFNAALESDAKCALTTNGSHSPEIASRE